MARVDAEYAKGHYKLLQEKGILTLMLHAMRSRPKTAPCLLMPSTTYRAMLKQTINVQQTRIERESS
jgi:hypothetical protein